jgi:hypothetical protein
MSMKFAMGEEDAGEVPAVVWGLARQELRHVPMTNLSKNFSPTHFLFSGDFTFNAGFSDWRIGLKVILIVGRGSGASKRWSRPKSQP